jgi:endonuclease III
MHTQRIMERKERVVRMHRVLKKLFPQHTIELNYTTPWELMVAVQLSAQCTDKRVNSVTKDLFRKYKTLDAYVRARRSDFEQDIKPCGFYRNKAKHILAAAKMIKEEFGGVVPHTMEDLLRIPGVARKTANVVASNLYGEMHGIAVDTHIRRFAIRFDLSDFKDPVRIERDLMEIVPRKEWWDFHHRLVLYGRYYCPARRHDCILHPLTKLYLDAAKVWPLSK